MKRFELVGYRNTTVPKSNPLPWFIENKPAESDILTHLVTIDEQAKPELLAYRLYGDSRMYWMLLAFNSIHYNDAIATNVMNWPLVGQIIYYPSRSLALSV